MKALLPSRFLLIKLLRLSIKCLFSIECLFSVKCLLVIKRRQVVEKLVQESTNLILLTVLSALARSIQESTSNLAVIEELVENLFVTKDLIQDLVESSWVV